MTHRSALFCSGQVADALCVARTGVRPFRWTGRLKRSGDRHRRPLSPPSPEYPDRLVMVMNIAPDARADQSFSDALAGR